MERQIKHLKELAKEDHLSLSEGELEIEIKKEIDGIFLKREAQSIYRSMAESRVM